MNEIPNALDGDRGTILEISRPVIQRLHTERFGATGDSRTGRQARCNAPADYDNL
jgi:hypothetical protein